MMCLSATNKGHGDFYVWPFGRSSCTCIPTIYGVYLCRLLLDMSSSQSYLELDPNTSKIIFLWAQINEHSSWKVEKTWFCIRYMIPCNKQHRK